MRIPQNIPLCKQIRTVELSSYTPDVLPHADDDEIPIYQEFGDISEDSVGGIFVFAKKSYKNYEPPKSFIVPKGYKAVMKAIVSGAYIATFESSGLGFVYIAKWLGGNNNGLWVIDIVKE